MRDTSVSGEANLRVMWERGIGRSQLRKKTKNQQALIKLYDSLQKCFTVAYKNSEGCLNQRGCNKRLKSDFDALMRAKEVTPKWSGINRE